MDLGTFGKAELPVWTKSMQPNNGAARTDHRKDDMATVDPDSVVNIMKPIHKIGLKGSPPNQLRDINT
jgi:hypothetical protein